MTTCTLESGGCIKIDLKAWNDNHDMENIGHLWMDTTYLGVCPMLYAFTLR
jgi:hypothetical protein